jgi:hypothetical protein
MTNPNCGICGKSTVRFENPERYECPNESSHAAIIQSGTKGTKPGNAAGGRKINPNSQENQRRKKK